ncbi:MAG: 4Fe-4S dicluster domain-containing protein [Coriobacteriia bacterium]|nr:4Fe-4S dicluster domain-containing protein [Coriobacteriia bacterium]
MARMCMVIDKRRCIGCHSCTVACRTWNQLPIDIVYNPVLSEGTQGKFPNVHRTWTPMLCQHCAKPACVPACPTGASKQDADGTVWIEYKKCMACKVCVNACPYGMRDQSKFEPRLHQFIRKCTFCRDRREYEGDYAKSTYCVDTCHQKARVFGDLDDPNSEVHKLVNRVKTTRIFENLNTEPQIYYIDDMGGAL